MTEQSVNSHFTKLIVNSNRTLAFREFEAVSIARLKEDDTVVSERSYKANVHCQQRDMREHLHLRLVSDLVRLMLQYSVPVKLTLCGRV